MVTGAVASIMTRRCTAGPQLPAASPARTCMYHVPSAVTGAVHVAAVESATAAGTVPGSLSKSLLYMTTPDLSAEACQAKVGVALA